MTERVWPEGMDRASGVLSLTLLLLACLPDVEETLLLFFYPPGEI